MTDIIETKPTVTPEQLDLIRHTIATGATPDELRLYLFDCARQGVHPLDKLIHFTKRGGKYTPITSIDFMRIRAAETGEMAGSDDPVFRYGDHDELISATVTVYRLTNGQRFPYTATAWWSEYKPDQDFMWKKMKHTMFGKCAEGLALRKGFPRPLAGLYAQEEMDQAEERRGYTVTAPAPDVNPEHPAAMSADGAVTIVRVDVTDTRNPNLKKALVTTSSGETFGTVNQQLTSLAEQCAQEACLVRITSKPSSYGPVITTIARVAIASPSAVTPAVWPVYADDIPF